MIETRADLDTLAQDLLAEKVVAVVVAAEGAALQPEDVIAFTEGKLARFKMPKQVEMVDELPRNPQGKILKRVLREPFWKEHDSQLL